MHVQEIPKLEQDSYKATKNHRRRQIIASRSKIDDDGDVERVIVDIGLVASDVVKGRTISVRVVSYQSNVFR